MQRWIFPAFFLRINLRIGGGSWITASQLESERKTKIHLDHRSVMPPSGSQIVIDW